MNSTTFLYGIIVGIVPPLLWLWFWLGENNIHPEPRAILAKCFFCGMAGVFVALLFQWMTQPLFAANDNFYRYIVWAAIEEIVKFGAVFLVAFRAGKLDEPIDAMIYMITAALGFAALENVLFMLGAVSGANVISAILAGDMRFIGAILVHVVASATVGCMIALAFYSSRALKVTAAIVGLCLATALHAAFNLSIITSTSGDILGVFAWVWAGVVVLILMFEEVKGIEVNREAKT